MRSFLLCPVSLCLLHPLDTLPIPIYCELFMSLDTMRAQVSLEMIQEVTQ